MNNATKEECKDFLSQYFKAENKTLALEHTNDCLHCLDGLIQLEMTLSNLKKQFANKEKLNLTLSSEQLILLAEEFAENGASAGQEWMEKGDWKKLWNNSANMSYFLALVSSLESQHSELIKTPQYLKNIVQDRLKRSQLDIKQTSIVIRMKEGLELLGAFADNLFHIPEQSEAFTVRSTSVANTVNPGLLQFYTQEEKSQKILYQAVKDGHNTIMLTIKLQDFRPLPKLLKIKRDDRLLFSFRLKEDFAYFPQMAEGDYVIELNDANGHLVKSIDITLTND